MPHTDHDPYDSHQSLVGSLYPQSVTSHNSDCWTVSIYEKWNQKFFSFWLTRARPLRRLLSQSKVFNNNWHRMWTLSHFNLKRICPVNCQPIDRTYAVGPTAVYMLDGQTLWLTGSYQSGGSNLVVPDWSKLQFWELNGQCFNKTMALWRVINDYWSQTKDRLSANFVVSNFGPTS